ncbi:MAG TPA: hypothetical protein VHF88_02460 [Thermoleophilaceae bacterium]|nr:hypothetical protein [Thermoleophilaceae bacterium]
MATLLLAVVVAATGAPQARGDYGDDYGVAAINDGPGPLEDAPAIPGRHAFWAGACDLSAAPAPGPAPIPGGVGNRPAEILAPNGDMLARQGDWMDGSPFPPEFTTEYPPGSGRRWLDFNQNGIPESAPTNDSPMVKSQVFVPAPPTPDHCIDWGAMTLYNDQPGIWQSFPWGGDWGSGDFGQNEPGCDASNPCSFAPSWRLPAVTQAGAHPDGTTLFAWNRNTEGRGTNIGAVDGSVDNIQVDLPPGFVGNPQAVPQCTAEQFAVKPLQCPPETQIGILRLHIQAVSFGGANLGAHGYDTTYPVYNLEPRPGRVAEIGFAYASGENAVTVRLTGKARTNGDFGVTAYAGQIPSALIAIAQSFTLWGVPWEAENDLWRTKLGHRENNPCTQQPGTPSANHYIPPGGLTVLSSGEDCQAHYQPRWGPIKPFLTNETDCNPAPTVTLTTDSFQHPGRFTAEGDPDLSDGNWKRYQSISPPVTGCASLGFAPDIDFQPTSSQADDASGLNVGLSIPQNNDARNGAGAPLAPPAQGASQAAVDNYVEAATDYWESPAGRATAHLKDTVVTLPKGMSVNPSAAAGLQACSDAQVGLRQLGNPPLFNNGDPFNKDGGADGAECPDGSKIGTVQVQTPLLAEKLTGDVVLGEPKSTNPQSGEMFRLFLVVRNHERGLIAKIYGSSTADPNDGQLTTRFLNNPELPFDRLDLSIKGGDRGLLGLPQRCGGHGWASTFTPWSSGANVDDSGGFALSRNCGFGFSPALDAGMSTQAARGRGAFSFTFSRTDGQQWLRGLTAKLPTGLLASVRDVPLCDGAQASQGNCPASSRIGWVDAAAGSGTPFHLERKGDIYLTEPYKGAPYGLMVRVPVEAGPFRGAMALSPIVVRQALHVDRRTAQVTAISDPFPHIHHGIPLRVRQVTAVVDRPGFMLNPSDCSPKQIVADFRATHGAVSSSTEAFRASGCSKLRFKPRLTMRLTGRKQTRTGKHPGVRAQVRQRGVSEAGIERAVVRLPKSLALDPDNAQALCEFEDGTKPDLERHCPKGSIVGRARAVSPLLKRPLRGNVYFVKNVRRDADTGNEIRTLPMIIVALRGEIAINLRGESSTTKSGKLVNTFANVPDAPVSRFNLNIKGGRNGILAVTRTRRARINICRGKQIAEADMDGHNGKAHDRNVRIKTPCKGKKKTKRKGSKKRSNKKRN